jgi:hypothetical protein
MSKHPTYVMADDGRLYRDPVIGGGECGGWFVAFDDEDPPELVLSTSGQVVPDAVARRRAEELLARKGIAARLGASRRSTRAFRDERDGGLVYRKSVTFELDVLEPIPAALLPEGSRPHTQPRGEATVYAFGRAWG